MSEESSKREKMCGICTENLSKYCCPQCNVLYCSLSCYKSEKHSECSENFYRECVKSELAANQADEKSRNVMIDILQNINYKDTENTDDIEGLVENMYSKGFLDSDDELDLELSERIKDLDLEDADAIWDALTTDEKNEFEALVNKGEVGEIVPQWKPWWMYSENEELIKEISDSYERQEKEPLQKCPVIVEVPKLNTLTNVQPSSAIRFNILNVLGAYAFIMRYFNGEVEPVEATTYMLNICANLDVNANFDSPSSALQSVMQRCQQSQLIETDETSLEVMRHDAFLLTQGPSVEKKRYYCQAALSHVHKIFTDGQNKSKSKDNCIEERKEEREFSKKFPEHKKKHLLVLDVSKVKKSIKKIEYYLSFINSCDVESK